MCKCRFATWMKQIFGRFSARPQTRQDLLETIRAAEQEQVIDTELENMLEGVLQVSEMKVRDIMVPRQQIVSIHEQENLKDICKNIISAQHSRYPVFGSDRNDALGILLAKDLLQFTANDSHPDFDLHKIIQPTMVVPETQHLNKLLRDFRTRHSHMAMVVDEYGSIVGLVTMEDILEQIVGDIEDETDYDKEDGITQYDQYFTVKADTSIDDFNKYFNARFSNEHCETIGGFIMNYLGHIPKRNEEIVIGGFEFKVLHADKRRARLLQLILHPNTAGIA